MAKHCCRHPGVRHIRTLEMKIQRVDKLKKEQVSSLDLFLFRCSFRYYIVDYT